MPSHQEQGSDFVSVVVADGTRIHTQLLAHALRNDRGLQVVAEASNSEELLAAIARVPIDVVVVSHNLDDQPGRGTQVLREMRALRPQIKGVILLDSSKPQEVLECFRAGARGIFSKEERIESLCKCIRSVHEGQVWARSVDLDHALDALASSPLVRAQDHRGIELLSTRELQVVQHLAGGMTNREIAHALDLSPHTVKNYLFRIFDKLGVSSRTELLYLTMQQSQSQPASKGNGKSNGFSSLIEAAEGGDPSAQLRLAEYFYPAKDSQLKDSQLKDSHRKAGQPADAQRDPVSAYAWYLLAEKNAAPMLEQIENGKKIVRQLMSAEQLADAETKVAAWLTNTRKQAGFADGSDAPIIRPLPKKMHAGAR
jgi:DNA-binding NarL/FixJ family response regulator